MRLSLAVAAAAVLATAACAGGSSGQSAGPTGGTATGPAPAPSATTAATTATPPAVATASPTPAARHHRPRHEHYVFPVQGCAASPSASHHDYPASDIFTRKGCHFVATTSGRVDEVSYRDRWNPSVDAGATRGGRSVSIIGDDGVRYYGSHLLSIAPGIRPGVRVRAGQLLGLIDNSGDAVYTPTHVHYGISWPTRHGIWWVRRGEIWPQRYLAAWRRGEDLSPAREVSRVHRQLGTVPRCQAEC